MGNVIFNRDFEAYRHKIIKAAGGDKATADSVLDVMFDNDLGDSEYIVLHRRNPYIESTKIQRFNMFWLWPIMLVTAPIRFVVTGSIGVDKYSKTGRLLTRLIGRY